MDIKFILTFLNKNGISVNEVQKKEFGVLIRSNGVSQLDAARELLFEAGWTTPISCHREEGGTDCVMIVWNK